MDRYTNQDTRDRHNPNETARLAAFDQRSFVLKKTMLAALVVFSAGAFAQLGPAGVPGAPGLAPEPEKTASVQVKSRRALQDCSKAKNTKQCKTRPRKEKKAQLPGSAQAAGKRPSSKKSQGKPRS
jgi:hypothetical protein